MSPEAEKAVVLVSAALEQHEMHGYGELSVKTTPEAITFSNGVIIRIPKILVDKTETTR